MTESEGAREGAPPPAPKQLTPHEQWRLERKLHGLKMANRKRKLIARLREAMRVGAISDVDLVRGRLTEYEPLIEDWPVERLLKACKQIGPSRCMEILSVVELSPHRLVKSVPYAQREHLARLISEARDFTV